MVFWILTVDGTIHSYNHSQHQFLSPGQLQGSCTPWLPATPTRLGVGEFLICSGIQWVIMSPIGDNNILPPSRCSVFQFKNNQDLILRLLSSFPLSSLFPPIFSQEKKQRNTTVKPPIDTRTSMAKSSPAPAKFSTGWALALRNSTWVSSPFGGSVELSHPS